MMLLLGLFILEPGVLWAAQQEEPAPITRKEQKQLPPAPGEGKQIYIPGIRPFLWERHGADPYYPVPDRNALVELSKKPELTGDLTTGQGFARAEAEYLQRALANAKSPDSVITETILSVDTPFQKMRFGHGVENMVILRGKSEMAWQIILPPELGSKVVWLPKVCGNICLSPFLAQTETFIFKTEVKERETIKEKLVYIPKPVYYPVEKPVYIPKPVYYPVYRPVYQESGSSRCGKKCKIIIGVGIGVGVGAGVYFGTRGHEQQAVVPYKPPGGGGKVD
jgi:hypothetical protein